MVTNPNGDGILVKIKETPHSENPEWLFRAQQSPSGSLRLLTREPISYLEAVADFRFINEKSGNATAEILIDTGAAITIIHRDVWMTGGREKVIEWLYPENCVLNDLVSQRPKTIYPLGGAGGSIKVCYGRGELQIFGRNPIDPMKSMSVTRKMTMAFHVEGILRRSILGLGGGAFTGTGLGLSLNRSDMHVCRLGASINT